MITDLDVLPPAAREAAQGWLDHAVAPLDAALRASVREDLQATLCLVLDPQATPEQVIEAAEGLGPVTDGGATLGPIRSDATDRPSEDPRVGTFAGIPYDWRAPTAERLRRNLWDPTSDAIFVPRTFGAGWDLNLGAVAVRLGLIEPDAEDMPFEQTPDVAFAATAALPVSLAGAVVLHYLARGRSLPKRLPNHWNGAGSPDRWITKGAAAALDIATSVGSAAVAVYAARRRPGSGSVRAGLLAASTSAATIAAAVTVWRSASPKPRWWGAPALVGALAGSTGATLLGLARAGRRAEQRADFGTADAGE